MVFNIVSASRFCRAKVLSHPHDRIPDISSVRPGRAALAAGHYVRPVQTAVRRVRPVGGLREPLRAIGYLLSRAASQLQEGFRQTPGAFLSLVCCLRRPLGMTGDCAASDPMGAWQLLRLQLIIR